MLHAVLTGVMLYGSYGVLTGVMLHAVCQVFLIDFANTFGFDARAFLSDPPFEWDYLVLRVPSENPQSTPPFDWD